MNISEKISDLRNILKSDIVVFKGRLVKTAYQIEKIPTNFLISPSGEIVAKDLRGNNIERVLRKYVKK